MSAPPPAGGEGGAIAWKARGQGAPVVFLHGVGGGAESWDGVLARLPKGVAGLAWDMPGYGASDPVAAPGFAAWRDALAGWLDALALPRVVLVGHSIGGMIAQDFAVHHPGRVSGLVLSATSAAFGSRDGAFQRDFLEVRLGPLDRGAAMAELADAFVPGLLGTAAPPAAGQAARAAMARVAPAAYRAAMEAITGFDLRDRLAAVACPALLLAGAEDRSAPLRAMERLVALVAGARLQVLPGVGHLAPIEAPAAFAAALAGFLAAPAPVHTIRY
ncbi:MAG: alpha/beta fold hydrolase [Rhodobacteraceae bacterium]|jgi:pimeloyl-ACP methyl ester carboxylesterase|nr:alpha/beta fold hydrolase [Paracoccaceae bacterium]